MRVLIITNLYPSIYDTKRASFNKQQFEALSVNHEVSIIILISWLEYLFKNKSKDYKTKLNVKLVPYFHIPGILRSFNPIFIFMSLMFLLFPYRQIIKSDVLLLSWAFPDAVAGTMISRLFNKPTICKIHGSDINVFTKDIIKKKMIMWAMKHAKHIISVSKALKQSLIHMGVKSNKITVIYNGVDHNLFKTLDKDVARNDLGLSIDSKIILYVGNLKKSKGCIDLAEAYSCIKTKDTVLIYIGNGECSSLLKELAERLPRDKKITLVGSMKHDELFRWFNAADLVCLPSHNEGVPNVLLEAFSCGLPAVATRVGGIPEIFCDNCGKMVDVSDIGALSNALDSVLTSKFNKELITQSVRAFNWNDNIRLVTKIIEEIK